MSLRLLNRLVLALGIIAADQSLRVHCLLATAGEQSLVVHEWGTFTAVEDEQGSPLLGINVDTEPVPRFVHNLGRFILNDAVSLRSTGFIGKRQSRGTIPKFHYDWKHRSSTSTLRLV